MVHRRMSQARKNDHHIERTLEYKNASVAPSEFSSLAHTLQSTHQTADIVLYSSGTLVARVVAHISSYLRVCPPLCAIPSSSQWPA